jgi:hydrogenase nickel incorporation protein HypA/HybF
VHEASIALAIVDELQERTAGEPVSKVTAVHLRVGVLSSVVPEALTFAWDAATEGTVAWQSRLEIERIPLTIACAPCGSERTIDKGMLPICPVCGASSTEIVRGRELLVTAMEVIYADAAPDGRSTKHPAQERCAGA